MDAVKKKNLVPWIIGSISGILLAAILSPDSRENLLRIAGIELVTAAVGYIVYFLVKKEKKKHVYRAALITLVLGTAVISVFLAAAVLILLFAGEGTHAVGIGSLLFFQVTKENFTGVGTNLQLVLGPGSFALYVVFLITIGAITYLVKKR